MKLQVSGKLTSATSVQPSFEGCRIEALFDRRPAPAQSTASPSRPTKAEFSEDATLALIKTDLDCASEVDATTTVAPTSAEAPIPSRVSALSDAAGNFTLVFPDRQEIASKTVKVVVSSPAGRMVGELELVAAVLGGPITIEVKGLEPTSLDKPAPQLKTPLRAAIDASFHNDASVRLALTENLKPLRAESEAIANRVQRAFAKFNQSQLSAEELARRHYVAPGADPGKVLETVIMSGVDALRSSDTDRAITLRKSPELESLIKKATEPTDSLQGVVALDALVSYISRKSTGSSLVTEPAYTLCKAELEAEKILGVAEKTPTSANGGGVASLEDASSDTREADQLVKESVNRQMKSVTAPESRLEYTSIPNSSDQDKVQSSLLQTFQLRPGASDVTSYHDFHTLQIAFAHVWTEIFDGQLASLGRELYSEYVKLKDFSGSNEPDLQVGTLADLRRLMEEIKKLSQIVQDDMPRDLRGEGSDSTNPKSSTDATDVVKEVVKAVTCPMAAILDAIIGALSEAGKKPRIRWIDFKGPLPGRNDLIDVTVDYNVAPVGKVEIKFTGSNPWKGIEFQEFNRDGQLVYRAMISNNPNDPPNWFQGGPSNLGLLVLSKEQVSNGLIEFDSQETPTLKLGRYLLGNLEENLIDRARVTFHWR